MTKNSSNREKLNIFAKISPNLISTSQSNEVNHSTTKAIAQPSGALQIVHVTTGRVRLRTTDSSLNSILNNIAQDLRSIEGVREVAVNEQTGSLVVNFDEDKLSLPQILALKSDIEIQQPQASSDSPSKTDPFAAWKSPSFWKEQGISLIPMMTGLAVTGGLGIHGWVSIPVYMIAADATRGVIGYLGSQVQTSEKNEGNYTSSAIKSDISESTIQQENSEVVEPAKIDYSVVHQIPGRIRLNLPKIAQDRAYGRRLERIVKTDAQVTNVRVNFDAASIAIAYQSGNIPLSYWVSLMELALKINPPTLGITTANQPLQEISQTTEITDATTANHTTPVAHTAEVTDATTVNHTTPVAQTAEITDATRVNHTTPELSSLWTKLKSPAMSISLGFMANFPL
ncbi:MAG: HMA2 domain-containing protein [Nostoc sp.]|uniref:HMA2 domain-containing protein n=1 Tax=Nostoc sp. TaxID=1180 RepID=UPI002FF665A3